MLKNDVFILNKYDSKYDKYDENSEKHSDSPFTSLNNIQINKGKQLLLLIIY